MGSLAALSGGTDSVTWLFFWSLLSWETDQMDNCYPFLNAARSGGESHTEKHTHTATHTHTHNEAFSDANTIVYWFRHKLFTHTLTHTQRESVKACSQLHFKGPVLDWATWGLRVKTGQGCSTERICSLFCFTHYSHHVRQSLRL